MASQNSMQYAEMASLGKESNLIALHAPLAPQANHIVNKETLALMN